MYKSLLLLLTLLLQALALETHTPAFKLHTQATAWAKDTRELLAIMVIGAIYNSPELAPYLGFKGSGPALFFYKLNRHISDLDFDLLDQAKKESVMRAMEQLLKKFGAVTTKHKSLLARYQLSYYDRDHKKQKLKIDINLRKPICSYEFKDFLGLRMQIMEQADMAANKLISLHERLHSHHAYKDIYDAHFFLQNNWPIHKQLIESRSGMPFNVFLQQCIDAISQLPEKADTQGLENVLSKEQLAWAEKNLRTETVELLERELAY